MSKELKFHPLADLLPLMEGDDFDGLVADIKANGIRQHIALWQGQILDGRNRYLAALKAGVDPVKYTFGIEQQHWAGKRFDPAAYVISKNIHRRHLTTEQKRELIAKLIKAQPEKSNRQIAAAAKVDHKTVGAARADLERRGEIPHVEGRTDTKGRKQPARKQPRAPAKTDWNIDDVRVRARTERNIEDERRSLLRRLTEADRGLVVQLSSFFEKYPDQIDAFVSDVWFAAAEASADAMKAKFAAAELPSGGAT